MFYNRKLVYRFVFKLAVEIFLFCFHTKSRCLGNIGNRISVDGSIIFDTNGKCNTSLTSVFCGNGNDISQCIAILIYGLLDIVNRIVISCICNHFVCGIRIILLLVEPRGICKHCLIRFFFGLLVGFVNRSLCNSIYSS